MTAKRDRFLLDCGIDDSTPWTDDVRHVLYANVVSFLRSGGMFSWTDWAHMSPETCAITEEAGRSVKGEQMAALAQHVANALRSPVAAPEPPPDPKADRVRLCLEQAAAREAARLSGEELDE